KPRTQKTTARPGKKDTHQEERTYWKPSSKMRPQVEAEGSENPRKLMTTSVRMLAATKRLDTTIIDDRMFGTMCRKRMRVWLAPSAFEAWMYSNSRILNISPLAMKAIPAHPKKPRISTIRVRPNPC